MGARFEFQDWGVLTDSAEIWHVALHINGLQNCVPLFFVSSS